MSARFKLETAGSGSKEGFREQPRGATLPTKGVRTGQFGRGSASAPGLSLPSRSS